MDSANTPAVITARTEEPIEFARAPSVCCALPAPVVGVEGPLGAPLFDEVGWAAPEAPEAPGPVGEAPPALAGGAPAEVRDPAGTTAEMAATDAHFAAEFAALSPCL